MPVQRRCPTCNRDYGELDTLCVNPTCNHLDPPSPAALVPGTLLPSTTNVYTVTRVLGWGGMAIAYLTTNQAGDARVVKEMLPSGAAKVQQKLESMWKREAHIQQRLGAQIAANPPAFPPLPIGEGAFDAHGRMYMAMEFMDGEDLDKIQDRVGVLPMLLVVKYGIEACIILRDYLHGFEEMGMVKPIIHRDIKPANMHVLRATDTVCLLDFGIARFESFSQATMQGRGGTKAGTPAFAAPELLQRGKAISPASDIFCLCGTLWALIANAKEFPDTRPDQLQAIRNFVHDAELQAVLIRGTDENPAGRYQTAEELRLELVRIHEAHQPLPVHLQPIVVPQPVAPVAAPTPAAAAAPARYKIEWGNTPTVPMSNGTEYQRDLMGKVVRTHRLRRNEPVPNVNVVVADIVDSGGGHPTGVSRALTDATGYFHLDQIDTRVPIAVFERRLRIVVEETNGRPIHDETVRIKRPRMLGQRAGAAARNVGGAVASPLRSVGHGIASLASAATSWKLLVGVSIVLLLITFVVASLQKHAQWLVYLWPHLFVAAIACVFFGLQLRSKTFKQSVFSVMGCLISFGLILWVSAWAGWFIGKF